MNDLELMLGTLELRIHLLGHQAAQSNQPYTEWLDCNLRVNTSRFGGSVRWSVMPGELMALARDLEALYAAFPALGSVVFEPAEPNLTLRFEIEKLGGIAGRCTVTDDLAIGDTLAARFTMDQSYLPKLAQAIRSFVQSVEVE